MPSVQQEYSVRKSTLRVASINFTETELIWALQNKDSIAFSYLYDHYAPALNAVIQRFIVDKHEAEDALQEVFVKIWNNISKYDTSKGRLFTWMISLTRNFAIDTVRSGPHKKNLQTSHNDYSGVELNGQCEFSKFDFLKIDKHLLNLKADYFKLLDMAYLNGMTHKEISETTGMPIGTIKTKIRAAVMELRKQLNIVKVGRN